MEPLAPNFVAAAREVLRYHFLKGIWATAAPTDAEPLGLCPDLAPYLELRKAYGKEDLHRHLYLLDVG